LWKTSHPSWLGVVASFFSTISVTGRKRYIERCNPRRARSSLLIGFTP
jgi:hypothetical protein